MVAPLNRLVPCFQRSLVSTSNAVAIEAAKCTQLQKWGPELTGPRRHLVESALHEAKRLTQKVRKLTARKNLADDEPFVLHYLTTCMPQETALIGLL